MQGIVSISDGRTKNSTGDHEVVQKFTRAKSHYHPWQEGQGGDTADGSYLWEPEK